MSPYERALREQIAFLEDELRRYLDERAGEALAESDESPIGYALRDPQFRAWLLRRQLESAVR